MPEIDGRNRVLRSLCGLAFFALIIFPSSPAFSEEILRYAGATTLQHDFMPDAARLFKERTGVIFHTRGGNTDPGLQALLKGEIDIAGSGRFLKTFEKEAGLVETLLGWDAVAIVVHESNPVENLSLEQLRGIFSGDIRNWKDVGGGDTPIMVVTCPVDSGMRNLVSTEVLGGRAYTDREITASVVAYADEQVAQFPVAVTAISTSMVDAEGVKMLKLNGISPDAENVERQRYPLVKPLLLVTKGVPSGRVREFVDFALGDAGQEIIGRKFFRAH